MKLLFAAGIVTVLFVRILTDTGPQFSGWTQVTVAPGDTEWSIGENHCPSADTRQVVYAIALRNHIHGDLQPGQVLWVPTHVTYP